MLNHLLSDEGFRNWFVIDVAIKSTLLVALAAGLILLLSRSSAALRHRVWALLFLTLLLLPLVTVFAPGFAWQIIPRSWQTTSITTNVAETQIVSTPTPTLPQRESIPQTSPTNANITTENTELNHQSQPIPSVIKNEMVDTTEANPVPVQATDQSTSNSSTFSLTLIWLCGSLLTLVPLIFGLLRILRLRWQSSTLDGSDWQQTLSTLSSRLGLQRSVTLLSGGPQQMPMTFGIMKPCVVLPTDAKDWSEERRQVVLLHELAHVKRYDVPLQLLARISCALFWFHPLVWWSARRMRLEREHACDDCVLLAGQEPSVYASHLLEIAHELSNQSSFASAALCMARKSQLEGRLLAVLDAHRCRNQVGIARSMGCLLLALVFVVGLSVVHPTLQVDTVLSAAEKDVSPIDNQSVAESKNQLLISGTVLSSQGEPMPSAHIDLFSDNRVSNWRRTLPGVDEFEVYQTKTDASGHFRLEVPRDISRPRKEMQLIASVAGGLMVKHMVDPRISHRHLKLKLEESKKVRLQLIDTVGNPITGVAPYLSSMLLKKQTYIKIKHDKPPTLVSEWPRFSRSDQEGYITTRLPASAKMLDLFIDDKRIGSHSINVDLSDEPVSVALKPAQFLNGKVIDEKSNQPIAGAEVMIIEKPYRRVRTNADGSFRIARGTALNHMFPAGETILHVYPPPQSDYLFHTLEWKWPNDRLSDAELTIKLKRGIVITGRVVEKETGTPVPKASLFFSPQEYNNPLYDKNSVSRFIGSDMKYATDAEGRFRLPVWPGPGYLMVDAPTLDYVHQVLSEGENRYGKPGLGREYYDGVVSLNLKPGTESQPLTIELQRGVTLRRNVILPDGQPAGGKAFARSYLPFRRDISAMLPPLLIEDGRFELPGFHPKKSMPLFLLDLEHHCGKIVTSLNSDDAPIQLQKCGAATFQFEDNKGKPLVDYEPLLMIIVTPGVTSTARIRPDQPLWFDYMYWQNMLRPAKFSKTDAAGRLTVNDLIPGVTYRLMYVKDNMWDSGYEFTVRSGETTDVGKVVLQLQ